MTPEEHQEEHKHLHRALDLLIACYISEHTRDFGPLEAHNSLLGLMQWSYEKTLVPSSSEGHDNRDRDDFEGQRQMILLALAELALSRPGWDDAIRRIARNYDQPNLSLFESLKANNADRVKETHKPL